MSYTADFTNVNISEVKGHINNYATLFKQTDKWKTFWITINDAILVVNK